MIESESLQWGAHFWAGGYGRARPSHLGLLERRSSELQSFLCAACVTTLGGEALY